MKRILASFLFSVSIASTQPAITSPQIGFVLDNASAVRPVMGVAGNFTLGDPIRGSVVSSAFLGSFGIVKTESALAVFDASGHILFEQDAPAGPALLGSQLVYLTQTKALLRWTDTSLEPLPWTLEGDVLSVAEPDSGHVLAAVRRDDGIWLLLYSLASGAIESQSALPAGDGPVLLSDNGGFVFSDPERLRIRRPDATEVQFEAPQIQSLQQIGNGWIQATASDGRQFALDTRPGREQLYQLPEAQQ